jgi:hypothetical protein
LQDGGLLYVVIRQMHLFSEYYYTRVLFIMLVCKHVYKHRFINLF